MKLHATTFVCCVTTAILCAAPPSAPAAAASKDARVTQIVREVKLLPSEADPRPAALNDQVREGSAVRTGDNSRSELTFTDLTISRLGANTLFKFNSAGRSVQLDGGSILVRVPKDSGGGNVRTKAVSVAITGTTLILETTRAGRNKLIMLEGSGRVSLVQARGQSREVRGGQMLDVPAGATTLPMPVDIDLNQVMQTHPLITGFPPLPSRDLIVATARNQRPGGRNEPVYQGQPVAVGQPFPGVNVPPFFPGGNYPGGPSGGGNPTNPGGRPGNPTGPGTPGGTTNPGGGTNDGSGTTGGGGGKTDGRGGKTEGGGTNVGGGGTTVGGGKVGGSRGTGAVALPPGGLSAVGQPVSSSGGSTNPVLRRAPARKVAVPKSTPPPIR